MRDPLNRIIMEDIGLTVDSNNKIMDQDTRQELKYKEKMQPFIEKQKLLAKEARRRASEWRQSHEKPTKKQVLYYKALCAQAKVDGVDLTNKSKLDLKNMISDLLNKKGSQDEL